MVIVPILLFNDITIKGSYNHLCAMSAADSAHHGSACIAITEHMPTPTLTEVEIRPTDGSLHTVTTLTEVEICPTDGSLHTVTTLTEVEMRPTDGSLHTVTTLTEIEIRPTDSSLHTVITTISYLVVNHQCFNFSQINIIISEKKGDNYPDPRMMITIYKYVYPVQPCILPVQMTGGLVSG